jgi:hypothetical protein
MAWEAGATVYRGRHAAFQLRGDAAGQHGRAWNRPMEQRVHRWWFSTPTGCCFPAENPALDQAYTCWRRRAGWQVLVHLV